MKKPPPGAGAKAKARAPVPKKKSPPHTPGAGPGRPRKPRAPMSDQQVDLAELLVKAGRERAAALDAYREDQSVAAELRLLHAELATCSAQAGYLQAQQNHTHALKYLDVGQKFAGRLTALREIKAIDDLEALMRRADSEDALGKTE